MKKLFWIAALAGALAVLVGGCDLFGSKDADPGDATWSAVVNTDKGVSTNIKFTFSREVSGLVAGDITLSAGTGGATKKTLAQSTTDKKVWTLEITPTKQGSVKVKIAKSGVDANEHGVDVYMGADYTVTVNGNDKSATALAVTTTELYLDFDQIVTGLAIGDVTITDGTTGKATKGAATSGSGTHWVVPINVTEAGDIKIKITKDGFTAEEKTIAQVFYRLNGFAVSTDGKAKTNETAGAASTKIIIDFDGDEAGLMATMITLTANEATPGAAATKGALSGSGSKYELAVSGVKPGKVDVKIAKDGVDAAAATVELFDGKITWTAAANNKPDDGAVATASSTKITFEFSANVSGLTANDITITKDAGEITVTSGAALTATTAGQQLKWDLAIDEVKSAGNVKIKIVKDGITDTEQEVVVYKAGESSGGEAEPIVLSFGAAPKIPVTGVGGMVEYIEGGYQFTKTANWQAGYAWFKLDLDDYDLNDLSDVYQVKLNYQGVSGDISWKQIALIADSSTLPTGGFQSEENVAAIAVNKSVKRDGVWEVGPLIDGTTKTEKVFDIWPNRAKDLSGELYFSIYFPSNTSAANTVFKITDVEIVKRTDQSKFDAVTSITIAANSLFQSDTLTLLPTVEPPYATNQTIGWTLKSAGAATGSTISTTGTFTASTTPGEATVTATIINGLTASSNYTKDFTIEVKAGSKPTTNWVVTASEMTLTAHGGNTTEMTVTGQTVTMSHPTGSDASSNGFGWTFPDPENDSPNTDGFFYSDYTTVEVTITITTLGTTTAGGTSWIPKKTSGLANDVPKSGGGSGTIAVLGGANDSATVEYDVADLDGGIYFQFNPWEGAPGFSLGGEMDVTIKVDFTFKP